MNHTGRNVSIGPNTDLKFNQKKQMLLVMFRDVILDKLANAI